MSIRESGPPRDSRATSSKAGSKQAQRCTSLVCTLFDDARYLMRFLFSKQKERKYGYGSPPPPLEEQETLGKKAERMLCSLKKEEMNGPEEKIWNDLSLPRL